MNDSTKTGRLSARRPNPGGSPKKDRYPKTIAVDFDGVLHSYVSGWQKGVLQDPPLGPEHSTELHKAESAFDWLRGILQTDVTVIIYTCRTNGTGPGDLTGGPLHLRLAMLKTIKEWFAAHGLEEEYIRKLEFALDIKPHADLYLDDRAWQFNGRFPTYEEIESFKPWQKRDENSLSTEDRLRGMYWTAMRESVDLKTTVRELREELDAIPPWAIGIFGLAKEIASSGGLIEWLMTRSEPRQ